MAANQGGSKLGAVVAAEVADFEELIETDKAVAQQMLRTCRKIFSDMVAEHEGVLVAPPGEKAIAVFRSAVPAVRCAMEFNDEITAQNTEVPEHRRMKYRSFVHMGPVQGAGKDARGPTLDAAVQLAGLAEPGHICVSESIYSHVNNRVDLVFEELGEYPGGGGKEVQVYKGLDGTDFFASQAGKARGVDTDAGGRSLVRAIAIGIVVLAAVVAVVAWQSGEDLFSDSQDIAGAANRVLPAANIEGLIKKGDVEIELPDLIRVERSGLFPEGLEYDSKNKRFLLGSAAEGTIFWVGDDGSHSPFIEDDDLRSSAGIHVDLENDRLLVVNTDPGVYTGATPEGSTASLAAYDLTTMERLFLTDLTELAAGDQQLANDVAVDGQGNAYVTDSRAGVIYKVDLFGKASVFAEDERFSHDVAGLTGVEYHSDGFLFAAVSGDGTLYKVPLDDPTAVTEVKLKKPLAGAHGMVLRPDGNLVVVTAEFSTVVALVTGDNWDSAIVASSALTDPEGGATTAAIRGTEVYVVYMHSKAFMKGEARDSFEIVRVQF